MKSRKMRKRVDIKKLLKQLRKDMKDEDEAKALLKEMQINLGEAQGRSLQQNYRCSAGSTSTCGPGTRTVGSQTSSWTKCGRCCRASTQRPSI